VVNRSAGEGRTNTLTVAEQTCPKLQRKSQRLCFRNVRTTYLSIGLQRVFKNCQRLSGQKLDITFDFNILK